MGKDTLYGLARKGSILITCRDKWLEDASC